MRIEITSMQTDSDIIGRAHVHWLSWQETYTGLMPQEILDRQTEDKCEAVARRFPQNTFVAKADGTVVGFVCFNRYRDDSLSGSGEIVALYVLKAHQRRGIGKRLLDAALERLKGYDQIALWVLRGNDNAIEFYRRYGFALDGVQKRSAAGTELRMIYHS